MTAFVAAWVPPGSRLPTKLPCVLVNALVPAGEVVSASTENLTVVFWDSSLWAGTSSVSDGQGRSVIVAGDPILELDNHTCSRGEALLSFLHNALDNPDELCRAAEGTYAAASRDITGRLVASTDKLGVRPLYWAQVGDVFYLSTVYWALTRIEEIPATADLRAAVETCTFGAPLANRTLTASVQVLGAGELIDLRGAIPVIRRYWDWTHIEPNRLPPCELPDYISDAFRTAVQARLQGQDRVFAFLSGGLDSRLIVAALRGNGTAVCTMNFAPPGSQDLLFGRLAAEAAGTQHFEFTDGGTDFAQRRNLAFAAWSEVPEHATLQTAQSRLVWSGDGGSVGLGHVYLTEAIVTTARTGDFLATARAIQNHNRNHVSPRSFQHAYRDLVQWPLEGIREDLVSRSGMEAGRNAHLYFMLNDQRRHLAQHYETLHEHRIDLVLPFFDGRFVQAVISSPVNVFLLHRLYNQMVAKLPFGLGQIPWQAYPTHEPCPVPVTVNARRQWQDGWYSAPEVRREGRRRIARLLRDLTSNDFPSEVLHRPTLMAAALAALAGTHRFSHLLRPIEPVCRALRCVGEPR